MDFSLRAADVVAAEHHRRLLIEAERERRVGAFPRRLNVAAIRQQIATRALGAGLIGAPSWVGLARRDAAPVGCPVAPRVIARDAD